MNVEVLKLRFVNQLANLLKFILLNYHCIFLDNIKGSFKKNFELASILYEAHRP